MNLPPIAMLHYISDSIHPSLQDWCISRKAFLQFIDYLLKNEYEAITFADIMADKQLLFSNSKKVILTFDDCPRMLFDFAIPELVNRKMKAAFFIPTAQLGGYNAWDVTDGRARLELMNEIDLKTLTHLGMEIGAHAHHHVKLKSLSGLDKVREEVQQSKRIIEDITQKNVYSFAYPYASVPKGYRQVLTEEGYYFGLSIYQPFEHRLALRRFGVYESDTEKTIKLKLSKQYKWMRRFYDPFKGVGQ